MLGADRHECTEEQLGYRNGYRPRSLATQADDIYLLIPKLRSRNCPKPIRLMGGVKQVDRYGFLF